MDKYFRTQEGERVNIIEHTLEQLNKWPHLKMYIGTDSQSYSGITRFVTCIVYRYGNRGAHFIYHREERPRDKDRSQFVRLYEEGERTVEAQRLLQEEIPVNVEYLEFDFAGVKSTLSTKLVGVFKGHQNAVFKGGEMVACKAADYCCRHSHIYK